VRGEVCFKRNWVPSTGMSVYFGVNVRQIIYCVTVEVDVVGDSDLQLSALGYSNAAAAVVCDPYSAFVFCDP